MARYRVPGTLIRSTHGYLAIPRTDGIKLFSAPSKMPGFSFGIPALGASDPRLGGSIATCPSAVTHVKRLGFTAATDAELASEILAVNGTADVQALLDMPSVFDAICESCYAMSGMYRTPDVIRALLERLVWVFESLRDDADAFVDYMVTALLHQTRLHPYFRIHDSGDFYSPEYATAWLRIVERMHVLAPHVRFWAPVRGWHIARTLPVARTESATAILATIKQIAAVGNTTVRPSQLIADLPAPTVSGLHAGTGVSTKGAYNCPSHETDNECRDCRVCWDEPDRVVVYRGHAGLSSTAKILPVLN